MNSPDAKNREGKDYEELKEFFKGLDFYNLLENKIEVERRKISDSVENIKYRKEVSVVLLGKEMTLLLLEEDDVIKRDDGSIFVEKSFNFSLKFNATLLLESFVKFVENFDTNFDYEIHSRIQRNKNSDIGDSMKGSGIKFYEKMLDFINSFMQHAEGESGENFNAVHKVVKSSDMRVSEWLEKFQPVLEAREYVSVNDKKTEWEKLYSTE